MNESDRIRQSYDQVPYDSFPYAVAHPDRIGVVGALRGIGTARADRCRVLELGCASAGNLIPMAELLPESQFVGIDLSSNQIDQGNRLVRDLGLTNIQLRAQSIMDFPEDAGEFDYIIAHGVYSWVPIEVRHKLLEICGKHLAPAGLCFISCKTYPGWHMNDVLRDLMRFHARNQPEGIAQAHAAREVLEFATTAFNNGAPQATVARQMALNLLSVPEMYLCHDHLSATSHPVMFKDFAAEISDRGLSYISHADPVSDLLWRMPGDWQQKIGGWCKSPVEVEQYVDFLCWRSIRANILCRSDAVVASGPVSSTLLAMHAAGRPLETALDATQTAFKYSIGELAINVSDSAVIHAVRQLKSAWPNSISVATLLQQIPANSRGPESTLATRVTDHLLSAYRIKLIELWNRPVECVTRSSLLPKATRLARWQAERSSGITTLRHETYQANDVTRRLILQLNGNQPIGAIKQGMKPFASDSEVDQLLAALGAESLLLKS